MEVKCVETTMSDLKCSNAKRNTVSHYSSPKWIHVVRNDLSLSMKTIFTKAVCRDIVLSLEEEIEYISDDLSKVKVFGKVYSIPRKQAAYGDIGVSYRYSGTTIQAKAWTPILQYLRDTVLENTGHYYNFVLINRYKDGSDKMGFHKDDEKELCEKSPIASLTFGAERDFVFKHQDRKANIPNEKLLLTDGLLLLMNSPTNQYWYHSLPPRKSCVTPRINLTFRKIVKHD